MEDQYRFNLFSSIRARQKKISPDLQENLGDFSYSARFTSYLGLKPGDLIQLTYEGQHRHGLVLATPKHTNGLFLSSQYNSLLNVVVFDSLNEGMFSLMVDNLYKSPSTCNYRNSTIIGSFLGKENLRSFNMAKAHGIISIDIQR